MAKLSDFNCKIRMPTESTVTVLRTGGGFLATKTFVRCDDGTIKTIPYRAGKYFNVATIPVASADDLFALVERLESDPHALVVGGKPRDPRKRSIQRTMRENGDLVDAPRRFVEADIDGLPLPVGLDAVREPEAAVRHALDRMGEPWASADCRWQLSASAGMPGNEHVLRARLWFWLDRSMDGSALKFALRSVNHRLGGGLRKPVVDWRLATANHIHYVAKPVFVDMEDPVPVRSGTLRAGGALRTALLEPEALTPPPRRQSGRSSAAAPHPAGGNVVRLVTIPETLRGVRADLLRLANHLFGGPVPDGYRNDYMLCWAMASAVEAPAEYWKLVQEGAKLLVPGKDEAWLRGKLSSVTERVARHMAEQWVWFAGKERTPIYTPSIRWYCDFLGLDRETIRAAGLTTLVDDATRIRLRRAATGATGKRAEALRRTFGKVTAAEELLAADLGRSPTDGEVAALAGVGRSTVNRIRNRDVSGWGKTLQDGGSEGAACQQLQILYAPVRHHHDDGSLGEFTRSPSGDPCAHDPAEEASAHPEMAPSTPKVVPMPPRRPEKGLWSNLPVSRGPDTRRRQPDAPAPVSDGSADFWASSFEEWVAAVGGG